MKNKINSYSIEKHDMILEDYLKELFGLKKQSNNKHSTSNKSNNKILNSKGIKD